MRSTTGAPACLGRGAGLILLVRGGACSGLKSPPFRKYLGTIHAGAQFLLAEAVSGAAFAGAFASQLAQAVPLIEKLGTHYVGRAVGDLQARADADLPAAYAQYQAEGARPDWRCRSA